MWGRVMQVIVMKLTQKEYNKSLIELFRMQTGLWKSTSNDDWSALYHLVKGRKDEDTCLREEFIAASLLLLNYGQKKTKEKHQEKQSNSMMMHLYLKKTIVQSLSLVFWLHINGCWLILQCACMCKIWRAWKKELLKVLPRSTLASWVLFTLVKCIYNWVMYSYSL